MKGAHNKTGQDHDQEHDYSQESVKGNDRKEAEPGIPDPADAHEGPDVQIVAGEQQYDHSEQQVDSPLNPGLEDGACRFGSEARAK